MNIHQYRIIRQRLRNLVTYDQHAGPGGEYHIRSLYFDDINNKALYEKLAGVRDRVKYRIRIYNVTDSTIHFEKNQIPGLHCQAEGAAHKGDGRSDHGRSIRMSLSAGQAIDDGAVSRDEA